MVGGILRIGGKVQGDRLPDHGVGIGADGKDIVALVQFIARETGVVQYPFGYGLSYTDFDWEIVDAPADGSAITKDGTVSVTVKVTNTGSRAGKDVVQLYYTAPYIKGEIDCGLIPFVADVDVLGVVGVAHLLIGEGHVGIAGGGAVEGVQPLRAGVGPHALQPGVGVAGGGEKDGDIVVDDSRTSLEFSAEELALLEYVGANYDRVVVLVNSCNVMELGPVETIPWKSLYISVRAVL